mmetsp:Transcript_27648/g.66449  ORF Transcript_27648/g.66449 Transcript_27648/m.66449 type:complete len:205 (-) Transcript_27648:2157-2771(-)
MRDVALPSSTLLYQLHTLAIWIRTLTFPPLRRMMLPLTHPNVVMTSSARSTHRSCRSSLVSSLVVSTLLVSHPQPKRPSPPWSTLASWTVLKTRSKACRVSSPLPSAVTSTTSTVATTKVFWTMLTSTPRSLRHPVLPSVHWSTNLRTDLAASRKSNLSSMILVVCLPRCPDRRSLTHKLSSMLASPTSKRDAWKVSWDTLSSA